MDVISRTAFGIQVDSQNDFHNEFVVNAKLMFTQSALLPVVERTLHTFHKHSLSTILSINSPVKILGTGQKCLFLRRPRRISTYNNICC